MNRNVSFVVAAIIIVVAPSIASGNPIVTPWEIDWREKYIKEHLKPGQTELTEAQKWQMQSDMFSALTKQTQPITPFTRGPAVQYDHPESGKMVFTRNNVPKQLFVRQFASSGEAEKINRLAAQTKKSQEKPKILEKLKQQKKE